MSSIRRCLCDNVDFNEKLKAGLEFYNYHRTHAAQYGNTRRIHEIALTIRAKISDKFGGISPSKTSSGSLVLNTVFKQFSAVLFLSLGDRERWTNQDRSEGTLYTRGIWFVWKVKP